MSRGLSREAVSLIRRVGIVSASRGYGSYLVGGAVRDLLIGVENPDLDIVVYGDAISVGRLIAEEYKASIVAYERFGTCSVYIKNGIKVDLATARKERYSRPAALPMVEFSSLKEDMMRRDFTINAMAASLDRSNFGELVDLFGGMSDIRRGRIRVLHERAFIDDPTRILRAVRFESRFGFKPDRMTKGLMARYAKMPIFDMVSRQRLRDQLMLILCEEDPAGALTRLNGYIGLESIYKGVKFDRNKARSFRQAERVLAEYESRPFCREAPDKRLIYLMVLFEDLTYGQVSAICREFAFTGQDARRLLVYKERVGPITAFLGLDVFAPPSRIYRYLKPLSIEAIIATIARASAICTEERALLIRSRVEAYLRLYKETRVSVSGHDLKEMGVIRGPRFKRMLDRLLSAKLDGKVNSRRDELKYARALMLKEL